MVLAMSLIKTVPDRERVAYRALKEVDGLKSIYHLFGNHDILLILEAKSRNELLKVLIHIEELDSVNSAKTLLVASTDGYPIAACANRSATSAVG
jgi:hypothetical protein